MLLKITDISGQFRSYATFLLITTLTMQMIGCEKSSNDFRMTVDKIDELNGMILKGISISGKIESGCIANEDAFVIKRNGKLIHNNTTRVLNVQDLKDPDNFGGEVFTGDYVTLYIPDGKKQDIAPGDILSSNTTSCGKGSTEK
jgi:translation elongation factor EF-1alpha